MAEHNIRKHAYFDVGDLDEYLLQMETSQRMWIDPEPLPMPRPYGTKPDGTDGAKRVWLAPAKYCSDLMKCGIDYVLDMLGLCRANPGGGTRWWRLDVTTDKCMALYIPTAIDAVPPFAPAPPCTPAGLTISIHGGGLPEVIGRPSELPLPQTLTCVGYSRTNLSLDSILKEWLGRP